MALYTFNDNFQINAPKHIDTRYLNLFTPWASTAAANAGTPPAYRYLGLTLLIGTTEYWYQSGVADINLVPKTGAASSITLDNGLTLTGSNGQLGGVILHDTLLDTSGTNFKIYINGTSSTVSPFIVSNSGTAPAILGQTTGGPGAGIGVKGVAGAGNIGVYGSATGLASVSIYGANTTGIAGYFSSSSNGGTGVSIASTNNSQPLIAVSDFQPVVFETSNANNNAIINGLQISRNATAGAAGIGTSIQFNISDDASILRESNAITSKYTTTSTAAVDSQMIFTGYRANARIDMMLVGAYATQMGATRFETHEGTSITAANTLTLGNDGNMFLVVGNTQINAITLLNWQSSSEIGFVFAGTPLLKNNTAGGGGSAPLLLAGGVDYTAASGDYIGFRYDANFNVWHETARKLAGGGSAGVFSANNGLNLSTPSNVQLGGTLVQTTSILTGAGFNLNITGTNRSTSNAAFNVVANGSASASSTTAFSVSNNSVGSSFANTGILVQVNGGAVTNTAIWAIATGTTNGVGVLAAGDNYGVQATGGVHGVLGTAGAFGTAGVRGNGGTNPGYGVWGTGSIGVVGDDIFPGATGGQFTATGGYPLIAQQLDAGTNNSLPAFVINRAGNTPSGGFYGTSILYQLNSTFPTLRPAIELLAAWNVATDGNQSSFWRINGVTNGGSLQPWMDINSSTASFFGTGTAIVAINGATGIFTIGSGFGASLIGGSVGVQAINNSTSTSSIVTTVQSSRQGSSYLGANGSGTQFSFDTKDNTGAITVSGLLRNYATNVVPASFTTQFDFSLSNAGAANIIFTLTGPGNIIANRVTAWVVAANNAAAILAGAVQGQFYRNGDVVQIVH